MSKKKKRNVFNLPEELYRGILDSVHNNPNLYINPDPTVREDIHYLAYTLYAQRPTKQELAKAYIDALGAFGNFCDEIEARTGKAVDQKTINAAKAIVEKEKKARHEKEAKEHANDKDFFGNPKPYVHKYWEYEEKTEDTLALLALLKDYYNRQIPKPVEEPEEDEEEEVVILSKPKKSDKKEKKARVIEPEKDEDDDAPWDGDLAKEFGFIQDSDDDDEEEDDDEDGSNLIHGFGVSRGHDYESDLDDDLEDEDDEDDDEEDDDDLPVLKTPKFMMQPPKDSSEKESEEEEEDDDEDEDDEVNLDDFDPADDQADFDAWVAANNPDEEVTFNVGEAMANSNSHRLADSDDELSDDDEDDDEDDSEEEEPKEEVKAEPEVPDGMDPDDYRRKMYRALMDAKSGCPKKPKDNQVAPVDEFFKYFSVKNPKLLIDYFKNLPAYAEYLTKYTGYVPEQKKVESIQDSVKKDREVVFAKKDLDAVKPEPVKKEEPQKVSRPSDKLPQRPTVRSEDIINGSIRPGATMYFKDENGEFTITEFNGVPNSRVRHDHVMFPVEIKPEPKEEKVEEPEVEEEDERDEITFAESDTEEEPEEAEDEEVADEEESDDDSDEDEEEDDEPYYAINACGDFTDECDNFFSMNDGINTISINLDYLDSSDDEYVNPTDAELPAVNDEIMSVFDWMRYNLIHYRPSVILTPEEYNDMMSGVTDYDTQRYVFYKLGSKYVACYQLNEDYLDTLMDLFIYLRDNCMLTSFFKKYTRLVSDVEGFSFTASNLRYPDAFDRILNSASNNAEVKAAFKRNFRANENTITQKMDSSRYGFARLEQSPVGDEGFYESVLTYIDHIIHKNFMDGEDLEGAVVPLENGEAVSLQDAMEAAKSDDTEEETPEEKSDEVEVAPEPEIVEEDPNKKLAEATNTIFTLTGDHAVDLNNVGLVARKLQDFVAKEINGLEDKYSDELVDDQPDEDDVVEDDSDELVEEYFPNHRKEVKKSNPVKPQNKNNDGEQSFVIRRR